MIGQKVPFEGPLNARVLVIGEGPGANEAAQGRPFCGASGAELDYVYLKRAAGLRREDCRVGNVVLWRTDEEDSDPSQEDIERDRPEVEAEIEACPAPVIVAVGRVAAGWLLGTADPDLERYYGVPVVCPRYPSRTLLVSYHPAAAMRLPERYYDKAFWCFEQLGRLCRGEIGPVVDQYPNPIYTYGKS